MPRGFVLSDEIINHSINNPAFNKNYKYKAPEILNNLDLFTKGQPFELYKDLRENAPVYFHEPMPMDPEPGYWV